MGDRANLALKYSGERRLYIYSHWCGEGLHDMARMATRRALESGRLPGDENYAARIIFDAMTENAARYDTGWGLGPDLCDNDGWPLIEVELATGIVSVYRVQCHELGFVVDFNHPLWRGPAEEYVALEDDPRSGALADAAGEE